MKSILQRLKRFEDRYPLTCYILALLVVFAISTAALIVVSEIDDRNWQAFIDENHCVRVGTIQGNVIVTTGVSATGQVVVSTGYSGDTRLYKCDGDKIYGR